MGLIKTDSALAFLAGFAATALVLVVQVCPGMAV